MKRRNKILEMAKVYSQLLNDRMHPPDFEGMVNVTNKELQTDEEANAEQLFMSLGQARDFKYEAFEKVMGREFDEEKESDYDLLSAFGKIARKNLYFSEATMSPEEMD